MRIATLARGTLLAAVAGAVLLLERRHRARAYVEPRPTHAGRNLMLAGLAAAAAHLVEAPIVVPVARAVSQRRRGLVWMLPGPGWCRALASVALLDYTLYLWHIVVHRVPWLWRLHLVHHVDLDMDATTGLRFHAAEIAASVPWRAAQVLVIGVTPAALAAWQSLTIACVLFHHSNTLLSERTERVVSWILATPRMHAIHHSQDPRQLQSNFSSGLSIWDRLHGTARFDATAADVALGVPGHLDPADATLARVLALPFSARALAGTSHDPGTAGQRHHPRLEG